MRKVAAGSIMLMYAEPFPMILLVEWPSDVKVLA